MTKPSECHVRPLKTQISLGIRPVWSESSLSAWRKLGSLATHWAHSEDSSQVGRMPRLIWVFPRCTCHIVGFVMRWLIYYSPALKTWGLYWICLVLLSFCYYVILWFCHSVTFEIKIFVTLFSGSVRPSRLILGTQVDSGQMYRVYWNQAAATYLSLYFFIFLSLQFLNIREVMGSIPSHNIPKSLKMVLAAPRLILQWGSTIKVSIELPVATRYRHDMTEKLLKVTLNPNSHTHTHTQFSNIKIFRHTFLRNCEA